MLFYILFTAALCVIIVIIAIIIIIIIIITGYYSTNQLCVVARSHCIHNRVWKDTSPVQIMPATLEKPQSLTVWLIACSSLSRRKIRQLSQWSSLAVTVISLSCLSYCLQIAWKQSSKLACKTQNIEMADNNLLQNRRRLSITITVWNRNVILRFCALTRPQISRTFTIDISWHLSSGINKSAVWNQ